MPSASHRSRTGPFIRHKALPNALGPLRVVRAARGLRNSFIASRCTESIACEACFQFLIALKKSDVKPCACSVSIVTPLTSYDPSENPRVLRVVCRFNLYSCSSSPMVAHDSSPRNITHCPKGLKSPPSASFTRLNLYSSQARGAGPALLSDEVG